MTVQNLGPDAAPNVILNVPMNNTLTRSIVNNVSVVAANDDPAGDSAPPVISVGGPASEADIPTLSEWMLLALIAMLGLVAVVRMRT